MKIQIQIPLSLLQDSKRPIYEEIRVDPLFRKINKHSVGFHIFKIENDHIEALTKDQLGTFFDENVYIIYASAVKGSYSDQKTIVSSLVRFCSLFILFSTMVNSFCSQPADTARKKKTKTTSEVN